MEDKSEHEDFTGAATCEEDCMEIEAMSDFVTENMPNFVQVRTAGVEVKQRKERGWQKQEGGLGGLKLVGSDEEENGERRGRGRGRAWGCGG